MHRDGKNDIKWPITEEEFIYTCPSSSDTYTAKDLNKQSHTATKLRFLYDHRIRGKKKIKAKTKQITYVLHTGDGHTEIHLIVIPPPKFENLDSFMTKYALSLGS